MTVGSRSVGVFSLTTRRWAENRCDVSTVHQSRETVPGSKTLHFSVTTRANNRLYVDGAGTLSLGVDGLCLGTLLRSLRDAGSTPSVVIHAKPLFCSRSGGWNPRSPCTLTFLVLPCYYVTTPLRREATPNVNPAFRLRKVPWRHALSTQSPDLNTCSCLDQFRFGETNQYAAKFAIDHSSDTRTPSLLCTRK